jgi:hypothetical protein
MYYEVGPSARFTNKFLAAQHADRTNLDIHFNLYEDAFDSTDWSREPVFSWDQLLDIRARQIEAKHKPIVLYFSGGTDSYTIYKVFERNQIKLDAIYLRKRPDHADETYKLVHELFSAGLYDPDTRILIDDDYPNALAKAYDSEDWLWNVNARQIFGVLGPDRCTHNFISAALGRDDFVSLTGYEKPRLKITQDGVYSFQDDDNFSKLMVLPGIDCFFISPDLPELHVKQSYMLLNYIKSLKPTAACAADIVDFNDLHIPSKCDWLDYSIKGCGRFGDLNRSDVQHMGNLSTIMTLPASGKFDGSEVSGRPARWFQDFYKTNRKIFNNFTNGYMSVLSDPTGKLLLRDPTNVFNLKHFFSKMYQITF